MGHNRMVVRTYGYQSKSLTVTCYDPPCDWGGVFDPQDQRIRIMIKGSQNTIFWSNTGTLYGKQFVKLFRDDVHKLRKVRPIGGRTIEGWRMQQVIPCMWYNMINMSSNKTKHCHLAKHVLTMCNSAKPLQHESDVAIPKTRIAYILINVHNQSCLIHWEICQ